MSLFHFSSCMEYSLDTFNLLQTPPPRRYVLCLSPPHLPIRCCRMTSPSPHLVVGTGGCHGRQGVIDSIAVLLLLCYVGLSRLSTLSRIPICPFLFTLCIVLLPSSLPTMFPPLLYIYPDSIPSALLLLVFLNVFLNTFRSLLRVAFISVSYLSHSSSASFCSR